MVTNRVFEKASRHVIIQFLAKRGALNQFLDNTNAVTWGFDEYGNEYMAEEDDGLSARDGARMLFEGFTGSDSPEGEEFWSELEAEAILILARMRDYEHLIGE